MQLDCSNKTSAGQHNIECLNFLDLGVICSFRMIDKSGTLIEYVCQKITEETDVLAKRSWQINLPVRTKTMISYLGLNTIL
jgi:hypothetical protein